MCKYFFHGQPWKPGAVGRKDTPGEKEMDWRYCNFFHFVLENNVV